ncbi:hypothetical protein OSB04_004445 [Centaurea solstitialis]|uniref:Uncharacterized protein n=1 Tax=Centaurea solstitialis TaxID=347529 RepID=A0AA38TYJ2_9ASTR|nr:hypothetical protein OSB04_004445 [Centaurea solstitialis]
MEQGEEVKTTIPPGVEIQERGEIYFFYRPKVGKEEAHGSDDVQRMYIILRPHHHSSIQLLQQDAKEEEEEEEVKKEKKEKEVVRLIVMGRKQLPDPKQKKSRRPFWGFVELVTNNIQDVKDALKGEEYYTKKSGHRHQAPARALGEGIYSILKHHININNNKKKMHTHLVYKLQLPPTNINIKDPQEALNVEREASFLIQIKNPIINKEEEEEEEAGGSPPKKKKMKKMKKQEAVFPGHLQAEFGKLGYHAADPPEFLNYQGCEFLLISASDDIQQELGLELKLPHDDDDDDDDDGMDASCSDLVNTFGDLAPTDALLKGIWV